MPLRLRTPATKSASESSTCSKPVALPVATRQARQVRIPESEGFTATFAGSRWQPGSPGGKVVRIPEVPRHPRPRRRPTADSWITSTCEHADEFRDPHQAHRDDVSGIRDLGGVVPLLNNYIGPKYLNFDWLQGALVNDAFAIMSLTAIFFGGQLADRYFSQERFLAFSLLISGVALLGLTFAKDFWPFFV